jgi:ribosomal protein S18 acetylase RimI-like enzyme
VDDAAALARILVEANRATFQGLVPDACLDSPTLAESEANWRRFLAIRELGDERFLLVAETETGAMAGYALAGGESGRADYRRELHVLLVDPNRQRQGVGRRLMAAVAAEFLRRGIGTLVLGVQEDNPNRRFYERLGGREVGRRPLDWNGYQTAEILYAWDELAPLALS